MRGSAGRASGASLCALARADAMVHEAPPEAFEEYRAFLTSLGVAWQLRVLHPALEVAVARDTARPSGSPGRERVAQLHAKFTGRIFARPWFLDTSDQTPTETPAELLRLRTRDASGGASGRT